MSENAPSPKSALLGRILLALAMTLIIATETLVAWMLIPSKMEVLARAEEHADAAALNSADLPDEKRDDTSVVEVSLGKFSVTNRQPATNTTIVVDFDLYATVGTSDQARLEALLAKHSHRLREQVIFTIRSAEINELHDPGLGLIKRQILEKSNLLFGEPLAKRIVFSQYTFVEQ
mgnify:CR=1 FL=1